MWIPMDIVQLCGDKKAKALCYTVDWEKGRLFILLKMYSSSERLQEEKLVYPKFIDKSHQSTAATSPIQR